MSSSPRGQHLNDSVMLLSQSYSARASELKRTAQATATIVEIVLYFIIVSFASSSTASELSTPVDQGNEHGLTSSYFAGAGRGSGSGWPPAQLLRTATRTPGAMR